MAMFWFDGLSKTQPPCCCLCHGASTVANECDAILDAGSAAKNVRTSGGIDSHAVPLPALSVLKWTPVLFLVAIPPQWAYTVLRTQTFFLLLWLAIFFYSDYFYSPTQPGHGRP